MDRPHVSPSQAPQGRLSLIRIPQPKPPTGQSQAAAERDEPASATGHSAQEAEPRHDVRATGDAHAKAGPLPDQAAESSGEPVIRAGSPFAEGTDAEVESPATTATLPPTPAEDLLRYTAAGALVSSAMVLAFAAAAVAVSFIPGAIAISGWGLGLALLGLRSGRIKTALILLASHLVVFLSSMLRQF